MIYRLSHLRQRIMLATGCSRWNAEKMEHWFLNELTEVLSRGDTIQLLEFGTFRVRTRKFKNSIFGRDPKTNKTLYVGKKEATLRSQVVFKATGRLKANVAALLKKQNVY